jgi:YfiH family protein
MGSKRVSRKASKRVSRGGQRPSQESESQSSFLRETPVSGIVPRFEIPGWSERYGVVAGITGRGSEPGRGFDLGLWSSEPVGDVMTRWLTFRREMADFRAVVLGNQVHGVEVMRVDGGRGWTQMEGIDGWITTQPGILLTVTIADCVPVYLLAPSRGVALLHAGWRGTAEGILRVGLERLRGETGCPVQEIVMHCGIGICGECYEVGSEVMRGCGVPAHGPGPWHIDLREQLVKQARVLGLDHVTTSAWCSAHDRPRFYSHRASHGMDGRMVAYVGMPTEQRGSGAPSH